MNKPGPGYYVFFRKLLLEPNTAHEIHDVQCANAAANLDYPAIMVYPAKKCFNPVRWAFPFKPDRPKKEFVEFYDVQKKLKVVKLPLPWPIDKLKAKIMNSEVIISKYYFPFHILNHAKIVHTEEFLIAETAIRKNVPVIYEQHYYQKHQFKPDVVKSPFFQIAIVQSELVRQNLIKYGMPPEKVVWMHNAFSKQFLARQEKSAEDWRKELLQDRREKLVVYSGALYKFKGVGMLIDAAKLLPDIQFVLTGGTRAQVKGYQKLIEDKKIRNVRLLGWVLPRNRLVSLFQAADIMAHPHLSGKYGDYTNPVKFFQYLGSGTPIAATEIPPLMEFKAKKLAVNWCRPDSAKEFSECIKKTLEKYPRKKEGYKENMEFAKEFTWEKRIEKILSLVKPEFRPIKQDG